MLGNQIVIVVSALQVRPVEVDECRIEIVFIHKFDFSVDVCSLETSLLPSRQTGSSTAATDG